MTEPQQVIKKADPPYEYDRRVKRTCGSLMGEERDRDVEIVCSTTEFVAKLCRLAEALEAGG